MNWKRAATLGLCSGALAVWLAGAATSTDSRARDSAIAKPTPIELRGEELAAEIARLRERLHPVVEPQRPARNLFEYSSRRSAAPPRESSAAPAVVDVPQPAPPAAPALRLVGIAEDPGPDGPLRTAIISGLGQLYFVKEGDAVGARFRVQQLSGEVVELVDLVDATVHRLALK